MLLLAWLVDDYDPPSIVARFVSADALGIRPPATKRFDNRDDAIGNGSTPAAEPGAFHRI